MVLKALDLSDRLLGFPKKEYGGPYCYREKNYEIKK